MATVLEKLRGGTQRFVQRVFGSSLFGGTGTNGGKSSRYNFRTDAEIRDLRLAGLIYRNPADGGALPDVLRTLGYVGPDAAKYVIRPHYNPVPSIVSFYRNAFGGRLGHDMKIADEIDGRPVDPRCKKLVEQIWQWSNLDFRADEMTAFGANQGMVGIRIVKIDGPQPRVFLDFDDRRSIAQVDRDARGNVVNVYLKYKAKITDARGMMLFVDAEEIISKDGFSLKYNGQEQLTPEQQENPLGICPYVICEHSTFAHHAYAGSEEAIDAINFALSQLDESTLAHVWPYIFATSPAAAPTKIVSGRFSLLFSQTRQGMPQPTFDPMVPEIDFEAFIKQVAARVGYLKEQQPQLILNSLSLLSGISGETLQQVLKPAEAESLRARTRYEDAITRASQIAISVGIAAGIPGFDLGTGAGTAEAAERAFDDGKGPEAFAFEPRPALPPTVAQIVAQAQANTADQSAKFDLAAKAQKVGVSNKGVLRHGGMDDDEIATNLEEIDDQDSLGVEKDPDAN